jgi:hypothetical protein
MPVSPAGWRCAAAVWLSEIIRHMIVIPLGQIRQHRSHQSNHNTIQMSRATQINAIEKYHTFVHSDADLTAKCVRMTAAGSAPR